MSFKHATPHVQGEENVLLAVGVDAGQPDGQHHDELWEELRAEGVHGGQLHKVRSLTFVTNL